MKPMTPKELDQIMTANDLRQVDVAWMCGVGVRHARSWTLGEYTIPQYVAIIMRAYNEGLIDDTFLAKNSYRPLL